MRFGATLEPVPSKVVGRKQVRKLRNPKRSYKARQFPLAHLGKVQGQPGGPTSLDQSTVTATTE